MTSNEQRANLIAVLMDAHKSVEETNNILTAKGHIPLSAEEAKLFGPLTAEDILNAIQSDAAKAGDESSNMAPAAPKTATGEAPDITKGTFATHVAGMKLAHPEKFGKVAGHVDGKAAIVAQVVANTLCHQMVDFCKACLGPEWYAKYRAVKYPGGNESMVTEETKLAGYTFAIETVLKIKLSLLAN